MWQCVVSTVQRVAQIWKWWLVSDEREGTLLLRKCSGSLTGRLGLLLGKPDIIGSFLVCYRHTHTIMGKSKSSQSPMSRRCHGYLVTQLSYLLLLLVGKAVFYARLNTGVLSDVVPHWLQRCGLRVTGWFRPSFFSTCGVGSLKPNVWKSVMWAWSLADLMKNVSVGSLLIGPHSSLPRRKFSSWDPCLSHLWDLAKVGWAWGVISHWALSSICLYKKKNSLSILLFLVLWGQN